MLLGPAVSLRLRAWISCPNGPVFPLTALASDPLLALSLGILLSWKPGTVLSVSSVVGVCMGPRAKQELSDSALSSNRRAVENAGRGGP